jgi:hypothetical protein
VRPETWGSSVAYGSSLGVPSHAYPETLPSQGHLPGVRHPRRPEALSRPLARWPAQAAPAARAAYDELVARWLANGRQLPDAAGPVSVNEMILAFVRDADAHYHRSDGGSCEADGVGDAARVVRG